MGGEATQADDAVVEVLTKGSDEEVRAFVKLLAPEMCATLIRTVPESLRGRILDSMEEHEIGDLVENLDEESLFSLVNALPPQLAADILEWADEEVGNRMFARLGTSEKAEVLREIDDDATRVDLLESIADEELADIVEQHRSDDAADLLEELPEERQQRVLLEVEADKRAEIEQLHAYPDDSAGGLMQTELLKLGEGLTVQEAIEVVRREYDPRMGDLFDLYVVDAEGRIQGRVRNRHLVVNRPGRMIHDIMLRDVVTVPVTMDQEEIAEIVQDYDIASVAVVDDEQRLLGRILVDDIVDVFEEEATEDVAKMAGTSASDVYSRSVGRTIRARGPWLIATFGAGLLTASLILHFETVLIEDLPLLVAVIPMINGMSGNVGTQAAAVTVRGIATGDIDFGELRSVMLKEFLAGMAFAAAFAVLLYALVLNFIAPAVGSGGFGRFDPALAVMVPTIAMALTVVGGAAIGTLVPLILHRFGRDPAVASAPFISSSIDILGISTLVAVKVLLL